MFWRMRGRREAPSGSYVERALIHVAEASPQPLGFAGSDDVVDVSE